MLKNSSSSKVIKLSQVSDKLDSLRTILDRMEPVQIPERLLSIPGARFARAGITKRELSSRIANIQLAIEESETENPPEGVILRGINRIKNSWKVKIPEELKELTRKAFDAQGKGPEALAFWASYKVLLPEMLMAELGEIDLKKPKDNDWPDISNYPADHKILQSWIAAGGNYGPVSGYGGVLILDEDDLNALENTGCFDLVPLATLIVRTGKGRHFSYLVEENEAKDLGAKYGDHGPLEKDGKHIGDFKLYRSFVVGPGSLHPSGKRYEIIKDMSPAKVSVEMIRKVLGIFSVKQKQKEKSATCNPIPARKHDTRVDCNISSGEISQPDWMKAIPISELMPDDWQYVDRGDRLEGPHPVHGSEGGHNLVIYKETNTFRCYRCQVSGGPVELAAILNGIIECERGSLKGWKRRYPDKYALALDALAARGYVVPKGCSEEGATDERPLVQFDAKALFVEKTRAILQGIHELHQEEPTAPTLLVRDGELLRIQRVKTKIDKDIVEVARPQALNVDSLRGILNRLLKIEEIITCDKGGQIFLEIKVPTDVLKDILALGGGAAMAGVPLLSGLIEHPTFRPDGSLLEEPGYDSGTGLFYQPPPGFCLADRPKMPTKEDAQNAAAWIFAEVLEGFRFEDAADKVNAMAFILRPLIRRMVNGPMPVAFINKRQHQTGGSKLSRVPSYIYTGHRPDEWPPIRDEDEIRKKILTSLLQMPEEIMIDNVDRNFSSHTLCSLFTSTVWSDRVLGSNERRHLEHNTCWVINGTQFTSTRDLMLRGFIIELNARTAHPELRTDFRHPGPAFETWLQENRGKILAKLITIIEAWVLAGRPGPTKKWSNLSEFTEAMKMLAAICDFCLPSDWPGFNSLAAERALMTEGIEERAWEDFLTSWAELWGSERVYVMRFYNAGVYEHFAAREIPEALQISNMYGDSVFVGRKTLLNRLKEIHEKRFGEEDIYLRAEYDYHRKTFEFYMPEGEKMRTEKKAEEERKKEEQQNEQEKKGWQQRHDVPVEPSGTALSAAHCSQPVKETIL
ncbi:MAG: hypothetical protein WBN94_01310 [Methanothrix sp.]